MGNSENLHAEGEVRKDWHGPVALAAVLLVAAAAALRVDCPLAQWFLAGKCPSLLPRVFRMAEPFGHGIGVALIALLIFQLGPRRRWAMPRVLAGSLLAGLAADLVKLLIVRWRPRTFQVSEFPADVWNTFGRWFPGYTAGSAGQSMPSSHTAVAVGMAMALSWLYPRGRWIFAALAVLVACQRMESGAHYLSDVLVGAAVGLLVGTACLKAGALARWFDRRESRWKKTSHE